MINCNEETDTFYQGDHLKNIKFFDSESQKDRNRVFRKLEVGMLSTSGIDYLRQIKPHEDLEFGMPSKGLTLEKCSNLGDTLEKINRDIAYLLDGKTVICWNLEHELLHFPGLNNAKKKICLMKKMSIFGDYNEYHNDYQWLKLSEMCQMLNIKYGFDGFSEKYNQPHRSLIDAKALMDIYIWHLKNPIQKILPTHVLPTSENGLEAPW